MFKTQLRPHLKQLKQVTSIYPPRSCPLLRMGTGFRHEHKIIIPDQRNDFYSLMCKMNMPPSPESPAVFAALPASWVSSSASSQAGSQCGCITIGHSEPHPRLHQTVHLPSTGFQMLTSLGRFPAGWQLLSVDCNESGNESLLDKTVPDERASTSMQAATGDSDPETHRS